jgi:hypothetical protein
MSIYQALIFATTYSIYSNMQDIYSKSPYNLSTEQVGCIYLFPGVKCPFSVWFLVPRIDTVYKKLTKENDEKARPQFRIPLANIGAILIPIALFW